MEKPQIQMNFSWPLPRPEVPPFWTLFISRTIQTRKQCSSGTCGSNQYHPVLLTNVIQTCSHVSPIVMSFALCLRACRGVTGDYRYHVPTSQRSTAWCFGPQSNFLHDYVRIYQMLFKLVPIGLRLAGS